MLTWHRQTVHPSSVRERVKKNCSLDNYIHAYLHRCSVSIQTKIYTTYLFTSYFLNRSNKK